METSVQLKRRPQTSDSRDHSLTIVVLHHPIDIFLKLLGGRFTMDSIQMWQIMDVLSKHRHLVVGLSCHMLSLRIWIYLDHAANHRNSTQTPYPLVSISFMDASEWIPKLCKSSTQLRIANHEIRNR